MPSSRLAFTFHACLGEGGYGEVYLARQITEGGIARDVAVKVLRERYDETSSAVKRLRDEGQALALLAHPVILGVHGFCKVEGRLALVTEYIEGADLSYFCTPGNLLPPRIAVEVIQEVADALAYAYTTPHPMTGRPLEMIHRDIKPANIRISTDGKVKLLDFGVARAEEMDRQAKTAVGDVLLTSGFASPEALAFGVAGPTVDIFALGVTFFAVLTGKQFYRGRDLQFQVTLALNAADFEAYLEERLLLIDDPALREIVGSMLVFQHEKRPTAAELAERLEALHKRMEGPILSRWARDREWPLITIEDAELVGKSIDTEGHLLPNDGAPAPPPPPTDLGRSVVPAGPRSEQPRPSTPDTASSTAPAPSDASSSSKVALWAALGLGAALLVGLLVVGVAVVATVVLLQLH